jgi:hypothetical protein
MITAANVMDRAAGLLNDFGKTMYTFEVQLPYLRTANDELQEIMESNNIQTTNKTSTGLVVPTGATSIGAGGPIGLPSDLIEIERLLERTAGSSEGFVEMTRVTFLPQYTSPTAYLTYWVWQNQVIKFIGVGATGPREIKLEYIARTMPPIENSDSEIKLINAISFLAYRTAALAAQFSGENKTRSDDLNTMAQFALERFLQINTKSKQSIFVRRRPFMASYKTRGVW